MLLGDIPSGHTPSFSELFAAVASIALPPQMMDVAAWNPDHSFSHFGDANAEFRFVAVVGQVRVKPTKLIPQMTRDKKRKAARLRYINRRPAAPCAADLFRVAVDSGIAPIMTAVHRARLHLHGS